MTSSSRPVAVLFGGVSAEHPVSLKSGRAMIRGLVDGGFSVVPVLISKDGRWSFVSIAAADAGFGGDAPVAPSDARFSGGPAEAALKLIAEGVDVVALGLHGQGGEDGSLQGFLQTVGLKYTGPGVATSAAAMDKLLLKRILRGSGLPTADWISFEDEDATPARLPAAIARARAFADESGYPVVVKALTLGSSVGVAVVPDAAALEGAMLAVWREKSGLFVERGLAGVEVSCAVFGEGAAAFALPAIEIVPKKAGWFDFESKYSQGGAEERIPARISAAMEERVRVVALEVHRILGADGFTRTDMIVTDQGPVVLETNTLPGMTATSLVPQEAQAIGWSFPELLRRMVENARRRGSGGT